MTNQTPTTRYQIPSHTTPGVYYTVHLFADGDTCCDCPDATYRHRQCKHARQVIAGAVPPRPAARPHFHAVDGAGRYIYSTHEDRDQAARAVARVRRAEDLGAFVGECPPHRCRWEGAVRA